MAVDKIKEVKFRYPEEDLFNFLKVNVPGGLLNNYVYSQVAFMGRDPSDPTYFVIRFNPEPEV